MWDTNINNRKRKRDDISDDEEEQPPSKKIKIFHGITNIFNFGKHFSFKEIKEFKGNVNYGLKDWVFMQQNVRDPNTWYWICWIQHPWDSRRSYIEPVRFNFLLMQQRLLILNRLCDLFDTRRYIFIKYLECITIYEPNYKPWYLL